MKKFALSLGATLSAMLLCNAATSGAAAPAVAVSRVITVEPLSRGYTVVSGVSISFERTKYKPGETASGTVTLSGEGTEAKSVTVSGGVSPAAFSLAPGESQSVSVKLSDTPGDYKFKAQCEDKQNTATLTVVSKTWNVGKKIEGGELAGAETVEVGPGGKVGVGVKDAKDEDEWVYDVGDAQLNEKGVEADEIKSYKWTCSGGGFYKGKHEDGTPILEDKADGQSATWWAWMSPGTATLTCEIEDTPKALGEGEGGTRDDDALKRTVTVTVLPVQLVVQRKGSDNEFASSARVAAGGKSSDEQQADVKVKIEGDKDVSFGDVSIVKGQEKGYKGANASLPMDGKTGTFTSSNLIDKDIEVRLEAGPGSTIAVIHQTWDEVAEWEQSEFFYYESASSIVFKPAFQPENGELVIPIKEQQISFRPTKITALLWDKSTGDFVPYVFSPGVAKWAVVKALVEFDPSTANGSDGKYSTGLKVKYDRQRIVDEVEFEAVGESVRE